MLGYDHTVFSTEAVRFFSSSVCAEGAKSGILRSATGLLRTGDMRSRFKVVCCTLMILDTIPDDPGCAW